LSTGFAVSFAVNGDWKKAGCGLLPMACERRKRAATNKDCGSFYFRA